MIIGTAGRIDHGKTALVTGTGDCLNDLELISPEILEPIGRQLGIADSVLDVLVSHPSLCRRPAHCRGF
jgi:translation initiation factor 2 gamma subunit (eIF-2gamma)